MGIIRGSSGAADTDYDRLFLDGKEQKFYDWYKINPQYIKRIDILRILLYNLRKKAYAYCEILEVI